MVSPSVLPQAFVEEGLSTQLPTQLQPLNSKAATLLHGCHDNHTFEQCLKEELLTLGILDLVSVVFTVAIATAALINTCPLVLLWH